MTSTKPAIVFVPGFFEGPRVFDVVRSTLETHGYLTHAVTSACTGKTSSSGLTLDDDIAAVRALVEPVVDAGQEVLMVLHSAGGVIGSAALKGLCAPQRKEEGKMGGVTHIIFLCAGILVEDQDIPELPFLVFSEDGESTTCITPRELLFNDMSDEQAKPWVDSLQIQPGLGAYNKHIKYAAWREVPSTYLVCEKDQSIDVPMQEGMASQALAEVERCSVGHMVMLVVPEVVVDLVRRKAGEQL